MYHLPFLLEISVCRERPNPYHRTESSYDYLTASAIEIVLSASIRLPSLYHPHPEESRTAHPPPPLDEPTLTAALHQLPKEYVYRVKGFIRFAPPSPSTFAAADLEGLKSQQQWWILNWAFGRWELVCAPSPSAPAPEENEHEHGVVRLTVMGERGEVQRYAKRLAEALGAAVA